MSVGMDNPCDHLFDCLANSDTGLSWLESLLFDKLASVEGSDIVLSKYNHIGHLSAQFFHGRVTLDRSRCSPISRVAVCIAPNARNQIFRIRHSRVRLATHEG